MPKRRNNSLNNFFLTTKKTLDKTELEHDLINRIHVANKQYHDAHFNSKNNSILNKFEACKEKFRKIMSIIEKKGNPTPLTNEIYFQAWTSMLYSDIYGLTFGSKTEEQFNALNKKILAIEIDINQLLIKKINLDPNENRIVKQLKRIDNLQNFFLIKKFKLKAECCYKLSEFFITIRNFKKAIYYFEKSARFYKEIAKKSINFNYKIKFITLIYQIKKRIELIQKRCLKNAYVALTPPLKQLVLCLERVPDSLTRWKIVNKTALFPTKTKYASKTAVKTVYPPIKEKWKAECKQLLNQIKTLKINDNLEGIFKPFHAKSLNERYAIVHNNYAITLLENLLTANQSVCHAKKLDRLAQVKKQFIKSAHCYTQAGLMKQKGKIIDCVNKVTASIQKLSAPTAKSIQGKINLPTPKKHNFRDKNKLNTQKPYYLTRTFFKTLCADDPHYTPNNRNYPSK